MYGNSSNIHSSCNDILRIDRFNELGEFNEVPFDKNEINLLQRVYDKQEVTDKNVILLTEKVGQQNHRVDKLEERAQKEEGAKEEREKWEKIEREERRRREDKRGRNAALQVTTTVALIAIVLTVLEFVIPAL